jgi:hypothetical protein
MALDYISMKKLALIMSKTKNKIPKQVFTLLAKEAKNSRDLLKGLTKDERYVAACYWHTRAAVIEEVIRKLKELNK